MHLRQNFPALTGLRAILAMAVVLFHTRTFVDYGPLKPLFSNGSTAVDAFFVLSGFILFHTYFDRFTGQIGFGEYRDYLKNRIARIYPVHIVTLGLGMALAATSLYLFHTVPNSVPAATFGTVIANALLIQAWFHDTRSINGVSWSISAEFFAYIFCPVLIRYCTRLPTTALIAVAVAALALPDLFGQRLTFADAGILPLFRITRAFTLGAMVYTLDRRHGLANRLPAWTAAAALALALLAANLSYGTAPFIPVRLMAAAVLILALTAQTGQLARALSSRLAVYLGEVSFSLYMGHWLVLQVLDQVYRRVLHRQEDWMLSLSVIVVSQLCAILLYHAVEVPGRALIKQLAMRQPSSATEIG
jgi:peptidoglycan/LPS O-acetylase OafA/YrhL